MKQRLIIIEGISNVGKSTIATDLVADFLNPIFLRNSRRDELKNVIVDNFSSIIEIDPRRHEIAAANMKQHAEMMIKMSHLTGRDIMIDRYHISTAVYGIYNRLNSVIDIFVSLSDFWSHIENIEQYLMDNFDVHLICLVFKNDDDAIGDFLWTKQQASDINDAFKKLFERSTIQNKYLVEIENEGAFSVDVASKLKEINEYIKCS